MKRIVAVLTVLLLLFAGIRCSASSGFYCEYTPKSERSSLFYIDIFSSDDISAAVMELNFDDSIAEFREASAAENSSSVRSLCEGGCVKIALADSGVISGKLCRVAFKALQTGTVTFTLHISQAADAVPQLLSGFADYSLEVKLGKDDVNSSSSASSKAASSAKSNASSRSSKSGRSDDDRIDDEDEPRGFGGIIDVHQHHAIKYMLLGAGILILIAALVFTGVILGRKSVAKKKADQSPEETENDTSPEE